MYLNLKAELARAGLNYKDLSKATGIKYDTLVNKLNGKSDFARSEMFAIKKALSKNKEAKSFALEYLFATEEPISV
jgi:lambda repressor-like predicted transcriptional regulator